MRRIFISYRRDDSEGQAGRLFDDLTAHFGRDAVFMDVAAIRKGLDFRRIIHEHVTSCGVLLVIIGKRWLSVTDGKGRRRLDDPNDFVRLEIAAALSRGIPVVPVRVHDAAMPTEQELPDALKELAFRNGTELTHARWDSDVSLLIEDVRPYVEAPAGPAALSGKADPAPPEHSRPRPPLWVAGAAAAVAAAASVFGYSALQDRPAAPDRVVAEVPSPPAVEPRMEVTVVKPQAKAAEEPVRQEAAAEEAAKAAAEKIATEKAAAAARAAAARKAVEEKRRRDEAERVAAQLAEDQRRRDEEQRKRDEENRRLAAEKAERERLAAEQAAAAQIFKTFAEAMMSSRQNNRR